MQVGQVTKSDCVSQVTGGHLEVILASRAAIGADNNSKNKENNLFVERLNNSDKGPSLP